jgi:cyclophilin family peptidyl-prolyl cis-trans isomerase
MRTCVFSLRTGLWTVLTLATLLSPMLANGKHTKSYRPAVVSTDPGAMIETSHGTIVIRLFPKDAPKTVANFTKLTNQGFYDRKGMVFHRVVPGFVVQTGDPTGTGMGGSGEMIPLEVKNKLSHNAKGVVAMARSADLNSASSQFYITLNSQIALDGKYAIFGKVIKGLPVLDQIRQGDGMYGVKVIDLKTLPDAEKVDPPKQTFIRKWFTETANRS